MLKISRSLVAELGGVDVYRQGPNYIYIFYSTETLQTDVNSSLREKFHAKGLSTVVIEC